MIRWRDSGRDRGVVLLNALLLVVAMTAAANTVLSLAVGDTTRLAAIHGGDQMALYLDAGTPLVAQVLTADWEAGAEIDHDGEIWATEGYSVPIDRGVLAGRISDLQGRFNLNWLASDNAGPAQAAFERLIRVLGLDIRLGRAVTEHLRPGGPANPAPYYNRALPVTAPGGTIATIAELRRVPGMTEAAFDTLAPHVAALPLGTGLNVNTASAPVLAAVLPGAALRDAEKLLSERAAAPFASAGDFASRAGTILRREVAAGPAPRDFRVVSEYFAAVLDVALDDQRQSRMIWLHRSLSSGTVTETYRMTLP
ncbi:type II secretion system minor pseudopilin GspK [Marinovum algicola]|uniref:type II secretion system minor pseudopilin GspK n=1 Tax=Marinovum algicola TaxID=42444 RepID=UPI0024BAEDE9|nr:type II secretion system minor pseudopilin GspK [Marinovum algicola]